MEIFLVGTIRRKEVTGKNGIKKFKFRSLHSQLQRSESLFAISQAVPEEVIEFLDRVNFGNRFV